MKITILGPQRTKPKVGDRRTTKKHGLQIRIQAAARNARGEVVGRLVTNGRPDFYWCEPHNIEWHDRYLLTPEERVQFGFDQAK